MTSGAAGAGREMATEMRAMKSTLVKPTSAHKGDAGPTGIRELLQSPKGRVVVLCLLILVVALAGWQVWNYLGPSDAVKLSRERAFICSETGKAFNYELREGVRIPVKSPYSGKETGYPAELCYWTKEGQIAKDSTPVLLNNWVGKSGPTFCPVCGRLVVGHNPRPVEGSKPPPTQAEYHPRQGGNER